MEKLVELVENGTLFQLFLVVVVVGLVCSLAAQGREVPAELWAALGVIVGYFFGTQATGWVRRTLRRYTGALRATAPGGAELAARMMSTNEDLLDWWLRFLARGLIAQGVLVVALTALVAYLVGAGQKVPHELWAIWGVIIGFFFGTKGAVNILAALRPRR